MSTSFVQDLVVVSIENFNAELIDTKVVIKNNLRDFTSETVSKYGKNIIIYYNKAYVSFSGAIESGEYLGQIDIETILNY